MVLDRLWPYLGGYAIIKIKGRAQEKCINLACARGVKLWDIQKVGDRFLIAKIEARNLRALGPILQRVGCKAEIEEKAGLPFLMERVWQRKALLAGAVFFGVALYVLSSFVWFIEVKGARKVSDEKILQILAGTGIGPGVFKKSVDPRRLEQLILAEVREVAWVGVGIHGTKLTVEIAEKALVDRGDMISHIVAARDALIEDFILLSGIPVAHSGDTVRRGDVLIRGYVLPEQGDEKPRVVDARGIVRGRTWYEGNATVKLREIQVSHTGRSASGLEVRVSGGGIRLGNPPAGFHEYDEDMRSYRFPLSVGPLKIPLEVRQITWKETSRKEKILSRDQAVAIALEMAREELKKSLPGGTVPQFREFVSEDVEKGRITARVIAELTEDIAEVRRFKITASDHVVRPQEMGDKKAESEKGET